MTRQSTLFVTGGAGFIGSNFVRQAVSKGYSVVNLDKLSYAGTLASLKSVEGNPLHNFVKGDIGDRELVRSLLIKYRPAAIVHFAAESHVDRSIADPTAFMETNVMGTYALVDEALAYWRTLQASEQQSFRFLHVSTDEVYGALQKADKPFTEAHPYEPNSPYAASKASSDHIVRAYHHTYGLPTLTSHCTNNYGPYQFPEKLIPLTILNARSGKSILIFGDGQQERNWIHVDDHCSALFSMLQKGVPGQVYNVGADKSRSNRSVVETICKHLDQLRPGSTPHTALMTRVADRLGHDWRYDIDSSKAIRELGWSPATTFETGLKATIEWYLKNTAWIDSLATLEVAK